MSAPSQPLPYYLGCPVWACGAWAGTLFSSRVKRGDWLREYSLVFNTVEGNSTFYALPTLETVRRWAEETADGFRFALKFPRAISHERELVGAESETAAFLETLSVLKSSNRLGPSFLQLGPSFSAKQFDVLARYLTSLPREFPYAVEVRHRDWFDEGPHESRLDGLLRELTIDKVIFDSRPLFSAPPSDEHEEQSQQRKPRTPLRQTVTGPRPMLRLVGRNQTVLVQPWIDEWAPVVANWLQRGLTPYVFTHAPADVHAPELGRLFHRTLRKHVPDLPELPAFRGELEVRQRELFY